MLPSPLRRRFLPSPPRCRDGCAAWRWHQATCGLPRGTKLLRGCLRNPWSFSVFLSDVRKFELVDKLVLPDPLRAERQAELFRTLVEEMAIGLPGETHATVRLDV